MLREEHLARKTLLADRLEGSALRSEFQRQDHRRVVVLGVALLDVLVIGLALGLAYWLRYDLQLGPALQQTVGFGAYQGLALVLMGILLPTLLLKGAYRPRLSTEIVDEAGIIISAATLSVAALLVITFMLHQFEYSRALIVYLWVVLMGLLILGRALARGLLGLCHRRGWGVRRLLVVGASEAGKILMQSVANRPDLGYEVVGFVDRRSHSRVPDFGRFVRLGLVEDLPQLLAELVVDEVIVALPGSAHEEMREVVRLCEGHGVGLKLVPDLFEVSLNRVQLDDLAGVPLLDVQAQPLKRVARVLKRSLDLLVAALALLVSLPLFGLLALLIRLDSPGPIVLRQERVGQGGRRFWCYKLRTMYRDADQLLAALQAHNESSGPLFKMRNDPRCTRVGRVIRRLSLDELPQLWNVLKGEMSLVGPRPPLAPEVAQYEAWQLRRLETKPGLTGLWQVSGRSDLAFEEMVMLDILYVDHWSLSLDLKILLRTITAVLAARGAY